MRRDRRVALLARDLVWGDTSGGSLPFSYAVAKLEASLRSAPDLADVETKVIDLQSDDPDAFMAEIEAFKPTFIGASSYIWSVGTFSKLASRVRRWDPSVGFVMGGPAARPSVMRLAPYAPHASAIDGLVAGEGEEVIRDLLRSHGASGGGRDWVRQVAGVQVHDAASGSWGLTAPVERPRINAYASPYHLGIVPAGGVGYLESFRGCPMSCSFCQWGDARPDRVHSVEYLAAHLEGLKASQVDQVYVVDAAFNLSPRAFRNLVEAERQVGALANSTVLGNLYPTIINDDHLALFDSFGRADINMGLQSIHPEVLKKLGRPFDLKRFDRVLGEVRSRYRLSLEIILGLPGDNPESFRETLDRTIELADRVRVFYCLALPDAMLETAERDGVTYDPATFEVRSVPGWSEKVLRREWDRVREIASSMHRPVIAPDWCEFDTAAQTRAEVVAHTRPGTRMSQDVMERLHHAVADAAMGWRLSGARSEGSRLLLDLEGAGGPLVLEVRRTSTEQKHFKQHDELAYSYRGDSPGDMKQLAAFIAQVHDGVGAELPALLEGPDADAA